MEDRTRQVRKRVIVVTDGDHIAKRALKVASKRIRARIISRSAGNPTPFGGVELVNFIRQTPYDPVIVMLDDNGSAHQGDGEEALAVLLAHPDIEVIGALAVASNTSFVEGVAVDYSFDCYGRRVETAVNKDGIAIENYVVHGDTVDILSDVSVPVIVGIGDIGKMGGRDAPERGAPITTKALTSIVQAYKAKLPPNARPN